MKRTVSPSQDEIERQAAAELRQAMAGSGPRGTAASAGRAAPDAPPASRGRASEQPRSARRRAPEPPPEPDEEDLEGDIDDEYDDEFEGEYDQFEGPGWHRGMSIDEERRAITELAMQQLAERPQGRVRPESMLGPDPDAAANAEAMRNQALSKFLDRQQQMDSERPRPSPREPVVQKVSGMTVSPNLTTRPTLTSAQGLSPELEAQYGMRRLRVDPANKSREQASDGGAERAGESGGESAGTGAGASGAESAGASGAEGGGRKRPLRASRDGACAGGGDAGGG